MILNMGGGGLVPENNLEATTITPGTGNQIIPKGTYLRGDLTVTGDSDLIPENIRKGIDIFGVIGAMSEGVSGIDYGMVTVTNSPTEITVSHSLNKVPTFACLLPFDGNLGRSLSTIAVTLGTDEDYGVYNKGLFHNGRNASHYCTNNTAKFQTVSSSYKFANTTYLWVVVA